MRLASSDRHAVDGIDIDTRHVRCGRSVDQACSVQREVQGIIPIALDVALAHLDPHTVPVVLGQECVQDIVQTFHDGVVVLCLGVHTDRFWSNHAVF